jgi:hypothetical protein
MSMSGVVLLGAKAPSRSSLYFISSPCLRGKFRMGVK